MTGQGNRLKGPVYARIITDPSTYEGFATIVVGDAATSRSTREVQKTARLLARGFRETDHTAVVVEDESSEPIAFATVRRSPFPQEAFYPEVDITAFGRDIAYKEKRLRDDKTSCGEIAVIAALDVIALAFEGQPSPEVFARVLRGNEGSHAIFDRLQAHRLPPLRQQIVAHGEIRILVEDQELRKWDANKPLRWLLDREVYVPPEDPGVPFLIPVDYSNPPTTFTMGRNEPCICDSGRKWKRCCQHGPAGPPKVEETRPSGLIVVKDSAA